MTQSTLSLQQSWKHLPTSSALNGAGVFGFSDTHKAKGGARTKTAEGSAAADGALTFNNLFENSLDQNSLSVSDPQQTATDDGARTTDQNGTGDASSTATASSQADALSGPLAPGMISFLMGLEDQGAGAGQNDAATTASDAVADSGDDTTGSLDSLLSELTAGSGDWAADMPDAAAGSAGSDDAETDDATTTSATADAAGYAQTHGVAMQELQRALAAYLAGPTAMAASTLAA